MTTDATPLLRTDEVTKVHNPGRPDEVVAVAGVSLAVAPGEVLVLKGPSGSGKTSLLGLLGCMTRPTSGRVEVHGASVTRLSELRLTEIRRRTFGFVFQQFHLIPGITVLENVLLPLYPTGMGRGEMRRRAEETLARLDLAGKQRRDVRRLSGGEQQRVAIARALVNDPEVLVADEPTAHLDAHLSAELLHILGELNREGRTIVVATHDPLVSEHPLVNRCLAMRDGRLDGGVAS